MHFLLKIININQILKNDLITPTLGILMSSLVNKGVASYTFSSDFKKLLVFQVV